MADLPIALSPELAARLQAALDIEGKIPRAFQALGPVADADVILVDGGKRGLRARQLSKLGARLRVADANVAQPLAALDAASADVVVSCWSWFRTDLPDALASAERVLRPGGRLMVLHDYGRDDVSRLRPADLPEYTTWSRRDGWFLKGGFKVRVIHCWWTFASTDEATGLLADAFGDAGRSLAAGLKRPRLSYNVAIYHRSVGVDMDTEGAPIS